MPPFLTGTAEGTRYTYNCPKGAPFDVIAYEASAHRVTVVLPEQTLEMKQEASASQVRFVNGDYLFLAVGVTGMVHRGNEMLYGVCSLKL